MNNKHDSDLLRFKVMQPQPAQLEVDAMRREIATLRAKLEAIQAHRDAVRLVFMRLYEVLEEFRRDPDHG